MAIHNSALAWKIPWMEEPGRLWGCKESDTTERLHFFFLCSLGLADAGQLSGVYKADRLLLFSH